MTDIERELIEVLNQLPAAIEKAVLDVLVLRQEKGRDYKKEYRNYHGKPEQIKNRSSRNKARRKLKKEGRVKPGDGKDVDHKNGNPKDNSKGNLRARDKSRNRADKR